MRWLTGIAVLLLGLACRPESVPEPAPVFPTLMELPAGFPEMVIPADNTFTEVRWDLGRKLFFDPILSADSTLSCASCHLQSYAFADQRPTSPGVEDRPGTRNVPSLGNVGYQPYFTREGGVPTLEMQVLVPIQEHNEFDFNIVLAAERLAGRPDYVEAAEAAYGRTPDAFVITRALACYERSLLTGNSAFDQFFYQGRPDALSAQALEGMALFFSEKTGCTHCHGGFNFTNYTIVNNGLYESYDDPGLERLTGDPTDRGKFKVPSLRNVAITAPYMHDGSLWTLSEILDHYQRGGAVHPNKSPLLQPFALSPSEKQALIAFLESLTDATFLENPLFKQ